MTAILWSPEAIDDLAALRAYISEDSPASAQRIAMRIIESVEMLLAENPNLGRPVEYREHVSW